MKGVIQQPALSDVTRLLVANGLPYEDLSAGSMQHFFACGENQAITGVVGLEKYGCDGLLRSLVVASSERGTGCGSALLKKLEAYAQSINIDRLYLLTDTAEPYFESKGYAVIARDDTPASIKRSAEFSELCPASATVMQKRLIDTA